VSKEVDQWWMCTDCECIYDEERDVCANCLKEEFRVLVDKDDYDSVAKDANNYKEGLNYNASKLREYVGEIRDYETIAVKAKALCNLICNSPPTTTIKGEIESLALELGHHDKVMNS